MPSDRTTVALLILVAALAMATMLGMVEREERAWERFKADRRCLPIVVDSDHRGVGWLCNDGRTYYR